MKSRYVVWLPCKAYVKRYLLYRFNDPDANWPEIVNLSSDKALRFDFIDRLSREGRYEERYRNLFRYTQQVAVEISKDDFYRYGWSMSNTEVVRFGKKIEREIKSQLFLYLDSSVACGVPLSVAIRKFQQQYGFDEDSWPYDSIRREFNRHSTLHRKEVGMTIFDFIHNKIFGEVVPSLGQLRNKEKV